MRAGLIVQVCLGVRAWSQAIDLNVILWGSGIGRYCVYKKGSLTLFHELNTRLFCVPAY